MDKQLAYIKGVMDGDGYVIRRKRSSSLCLDVKSRIFAKRFFKALEQIGLQPRTYERNRIRKNFQGYTFRSHHIIVRATCSHELVERIKTMQLRTIKEKIAYLQGFYDSEGCYSVDYYPDRTCYNLRFRNSDLLLLKRIQKMLESLGVKMTLRRYNYEHPFLETQDKKNIENFFELIQRDV